MATLSDVARAAGVSVVTVSNVLNGRLKGVRKDAVERAERVRRVARELGYRPSASARAMRTNRTNLVGVVLQSHPLAFETIRGIADRLDESGYVTALIRLRDPRETTHPDSRAFRERMLDGMILVNVDEHLAKQFDGAEEPRVWVDMNRYRRERCVRRDEKAAAGEAVRALHGRGYRKMMYVDRSEASQRNMYFFDERLEGFRAAARDVRVRHEVCDMPWSRNELPEGLVEKLAPDVAVVASDSYLVRSLDRLLTERGLIAGRDYALCCCDDDGEFVNDWPQLARVSYDRTAMGCVAAEMLLECVARSGARPRSVKVGGEYLGGRTVPDCVKGRPR